MLAKGFVVGLHWTEQKLWIRSISSRQLQLLEYLPLRIGLSEKISVGTSAVNDKVKKMDQKCHVSEKTVLALAAGELSVSTAGSAITKSRYVLTGAPWVIGAFNKVANAANDVREKVNEKIGAEQEHKTMEEQSRLMISLLGCKEFMLR